jgi:hypothetical protein
VAPVAETTAQRLTRFQDKLTNALQLQPHQECVLHHALLAQTEQLLFTDTKPGATLTETLLPVLRPDQQARLLALPAQPEYVAEFATLGLNP